MQTAMGYGLWAMGQTSLKNSGSKPRTHSSQLSGSVIDDILQGSSGVFTTIQEVEYAVGKAVDQAFKDLHIQEILNAAGVISNQVGAVLVTIHNLPMTLIKESPLGHAFNELDKFTGGMISTANNVSDLPLRVLRGDAISKAELLKDAIFVIQVVLIVVTFPAGLVGMVTMMVGRQVCSKQTQARDACMAAFTIIAIAAGSYASGPTNFASALSSAGETYLTNQGIALASQELNLLCQQGAWAGKQECQIMSDAFNAYARGGGTMDWNTFLANEIVKIGKQELMLAIFPPHSPEHDAITRRIGRTPRIAPPRAWTINTITSEGANSEQQIAKNAFWLLAAGAGALLLGAG